MEDKKAKDAMKAKEKEMKEEKEAERQVGFCWSRVENSLICILAADTRHQGQANCKGRERAVREVGGEDAQEASRAAEKKGEEE